MEIYKTYKHIHCKECKLNIHKESNIQEHCCQNFKLQKNIHFVRKSYVVVDTNVSTYRSIAFYSRNVKAEHSKRNSKIPHYCFLNLISRLP
jgi:hypothetical protein